MIKGINVKEKKGIKKEAVTFSSNILRLNNARTISE